MTQLYFRLQLNIRSQFFYIDLNPKSISRKFDIFLLIPGDLWATEIHSELVQLYEEPSFSFVKKWAVEFKRSRLFPEIIYKQNEQNRDTAMKISRKYTIRFWTI